MNWIKALSQNELGEGDRKVMTLGKHTVLLLRHHNQVHAVSNKCPHLQLPLKKAKITQDNALVCPWHHSAFDLDSGDVKAWSPWPPGIGKLLGCLSREKALPVFETKVEDGAIWVLLAD